MKISIKWIVRLLLLILLAAGMIALFVFGVPGIKNTILYPERTKLTRYYACSLAICTKGCSDPMIDDPTNDPFICLENYTDTPDCDVECKSICESWPQGPNAACGRNYPIELSLQGKGPLGGVVLKGIYRVWFDWYDWYLIGTDCEWCDDASDLIYFMKYGKAPSCRPGGYYIKVSGSLMNLIRVPLGITGLFAESSAGSRYPNFPNPDELLESGCGTGLFGGILDNTRNDVGEGAILLDPGVAREAFGCFKQSPFDDIAASTFCGGDMGYYQCDFQGDLWLWATSKNPGCADVNINSTPPEPGFFLVTVDPVSPPDRITGDKIMVTLDEEAIYTVTIDNYLGTSSTFTLGFGLADQLSSYGPDPVCQFSSTSETILDGGTAMVELRCTASSNPAELRVVDREDLLTGEKWIDVMVSTSGYGSINALARLEVVDMTLDVWVSGDKPNERGTREPNNEAEYTVEIFSNFNTQEDFDLSATPDDASVSCTFDDDPLTVSAQTTAQTTMRCSSPNLGDYTIEVKASHADTDLEKYDDVFLEVVECLGEISLSLNPSGVNFGESFDAETSGLVDCDGNRVYFRIDDASNPANGIGYCDIIPADPTGCTASIDADDSKFLLGQHTIYALIELTGDTNYDGEGEEASAVLSVFGFIPDYINILRRSETSPWDEGNGLDGTWGGATETNYIDPSWYGPTVSWIGYIRVRPGKCCWIEGCPLSCATICAVRTTKLKFRNINTGQETNEYSSSVDGVIRATWDLGTVSDVGYWQLQAYMDGGCYGLSWWDELAQMWEATMIPLVTYP